MHAPQTPRTAAKCHARSQGPTRHSKEIRNHPHSGGGPARPRPATGALCTTFWSKTALPTAFLVSAQKSRRISIFPQRDPRCARFYFLILYKILGIRAKDGGATKARRNRKGCRETLTRVHPRVTPGCMPMRPTRFAVCVANPTKTRFLGLSGHREKTTFVPSGNPGSQFSCGIPRRPPFLFLLEIADFFLYWKARGVPGSETYPHYYQERHLHFSLSPDLLRSAADSAFPARRLCRRLCRWLCTKGKNPNRRCSLC